MQLKADAVVHILCQLTVAFLRTVVRQLTQVVGLELDAVQLVDTAQFLDLLLPFLLRQRILTVLVSSELLKQFLGSNPFPVFLFGTELLRNGEERHDRLMVDIIGLHLIENLYGVGHSFRNILEHLPHLLLGLEPLLFGV